MFVLVFDVVLLVYVIMETQTKRRYYNNFYCAYFSIQREKINFPIGSNDYFKFNKMYYFWYCSKKQKTRKQLSDISIFTFIPTSKLNNIYRKRIQLSMNMCKQTENNKLYTF